MAIIYKKGEKDLQYTGVDKAMKTFGDGLERIKSGAKRVATRIPRAMEAKRKADAVRELDNISRGFGSPEKYVEMYPDTAKRIAELRKQAGQ